MIDETSKFYFDKDFIVRYSEMDFHKVLKPSAMLNFLQDIATEAADKGHFGYAEVSAQNLGWFLLKYHMEFYNYPQKIEDIYIKTEARGVNKLFTSRDFELYSKSNMELLGRVISQWTLVDFDKKSMVSPQQIFPFIYKVEKREDDLSFNKIRPIERVDYEEEFKIRYDDIDVNQHVNNMNYIVWAMEVLPYEFKSQYKLKTLDMVYKKEIAYGNIVLSQAELNAETLTSNHILKNKETGEDLCAVLATFEQV